MPFIRACCELRRLRGRHAAPHAAVRRGRHTLEPLRKPATARPALAAVPDGRPLPSGAGGGPGLPTRRGFGHSQDRSHVVEAEAAAIRDAAHRVLGGETLSSIVQQWNHQGLCTASGGPWRVNSLSSILVHPRLAGLANDAAEGSAPTFPAIIDVEVHRQLVALHASRRKGPRRTTRRYLLTGLLRCWRCGGNLRGMPRSRGADLYACPGPPHGGCSGTAITADHADEAVRDMVLARIDSAEFAVAVSGAPTAILQQAAVSDTVRRLAAHRRKSDELADMWASGDISREEWMSLKQTLTGRAHATEAEMARLERLDALRRLAGTGRAIRAGWAAMSVDERRAVVHAALVEIVVHRAEPPRQVFRPERLHPVWVG